MGYFDARFGVYLAVATLLIVTPGARYGPGHTQCTPRRKASGLFHHAWYRIRQCHLGGGVSVGYRCPP
jgi:hypothetical protein